MDQELRDALAGIKTDIASVRTDVHDLREHVHDLRKHVHDLREHVMDMKDGLSAMEKRFEGHRKEIVAEIRKACPPARTKQARGIVATADASQGRL